MSFTCLKKVVGITLFKMNSVAFRSGSKVGGNKSHLKPFGFHPYMIHFMAVQIIKDDNLVNCQNNAAILSSLRKRVS